MLILHILNTHVAILQSADSHVSAPTSLVLQWQRCFTRILQRLRQVMCTTVLVWRRASTFFSQLTARRISTPRKISSVSSLLLMLWQKSTICQSSTAATPVLAIASQPQASSSILAYRCSSLSVSTTTTAFRWTALQSFLILVLFLKRVVSSQA